MNEPNNRMCGKGTGNIGWMNKWIKSRSKEKHNKLGENKSIELTENAGSEIFVRYRVHDSTPSISIQLKNWA